MNHNLKTRKTKSIKKEDIRQEIEEYVIVDGIGEEFMVNEGKYKFILMWVLKDLCLKLVLKNEKEAEKKVASGLHGKYKIKKVVKEEVCLCKRTFKRDT